MTTTSSAHEARVDGLLDRLLTDHDPAGDRTAFLGAQFDLGLAWIHFPEGHGGLSAPPILQERINQRLEEAGAHRPRNVDIIGHGMGAPVLIAHGTESQQRRHLRPMFTGEEIWCQMFSEPGAGSDVAGLTCKAVRDGDEWVVNGQKVWTTAAQVATWGMLVTRTNPDVPKHKGLSYFILDMHAAGVDIRPLRQITGEAEFNEVYLTDVRIPDDKRVGDVGDGWRVALATLMNERVAIGGRVGDRGEGYIADLVDTWRGSARDPGHLDAVMKLWVDAEATRLTNLRAAQNRAAGTPGPEGSTSKLVYAEMNKKIFEVATDVMGAEAMLYDSYEMHQPGPDDLPSRDLRRRFLRVRANSIEGGTSEIMKNILGERVLGLPGEPRVDKDLPWRESPR